MSNAFDLLFSRSAKLGNLTINQVNDFVREYFQTELNKALALSFDLRDDPLADLEAEIGWLSEDIVRQTSNLSLLRFDAVSKLEVDEFLSRHANQDAKISPDLARYIRQALLRARIEKSKFLVRTLSGDFAHYAAPDPLFEGLQPSGFEDPEEIATIPTSLEAACDRFMKVKTSGGVWVKKTERDYRRVLDLVIGAIGGKRQVSKIDTDDVKAVRDLIVKLPANIAKFKGNSGKPLNQLIEENPTADLLSKKTQGKYYDMFRSFLQWLVDEEELSKLPGASVKVLGVNKKSQADRYPYSNEQLGFIFSSPLYRGCASKSRRSEPGQEIIKDGKYWIPLVALYSGMRLGEIVQLGINDVKQEGAVHFFDVTLAEGEGKKLKTVSSERRVPVHKALIKLGFLDHVSVVRKKKHERIFSDIEPGKDGYFSHNFSKWWGRYSRSLQTQFPRTAFHSFRHNFTDALREVEVPDSIAKTLVGHADDSVHASYGRGPSIQKLAEYVDRIEFSIGL